MCLVKLVGNQPSPATTQTATWLLTRPCHRLIMSKLYYFHSDLPDPSPLDYHLTPQSGACVCVAVVARTMVLQREPLALVALCSLSVATHSLFTVTNLLCDSSSLSLSLSLQRPQMHRSPNRELSPKHLAAATPDVSSRLSAHALTANFQGCRGYRVSGN